MEAVLYPKIQETLGDSEFSLSHKMACSYLQQRLNQVEIITASYENLQSRNETTNKLYIVEDSYVVAQDELEPDARYNGVARELVEQDKQALDKCAQNEMSNQTKCFLEFQQIYMEDVASPRMHRVIG